MNAQQVKEFQTAVSTTHWKLDFNEFCNRTGFVGDYAKNKWNEWQSLNQALNKFDAETLAKIIGE